MILENRGIRSGLLKRSANVGQEESTRHSNSTRYHCHRRAYVLLSSQPNQRGGEGGLASPSVRTFVTLTTVGVSAFITGFGARDVISRALATRNRMRAARQAKKV